MWSFLSNLIRRKRTARRRNTTFSSGLEHLEVRKVLSVTNTFFSGNMLVLQSDNTATKVEVRSSGSNIQIRDVVSNTTWSYLASRVGKVEFQGGAGDDRFVNFVQNLPIRGFGNAGNDYLEGYNGADELYGGSGNDTIKGYGGNDLIFGGEGNDTLFGMDGNDKLQGNNGDDRLEGNAGNDILFGQAGLDLLLGHDGNDELQGGDGNDQLNGGAGSDKLFGQAGDDVLIAIDNGASDYAEGGTGRDTVWVDRSGAVNDSVYGIFSEDKVHYVAGFSNPGADRTLDGDRIIDPILLNGGQEHRMFSGKSLFSSGGPQMDDIQQGNLGDCWLLAGLGAIALDNPQAIRHNVVDFNDGTYGVKLGNSFYRVDNDFAVASRQSNSPAFAQFGRDGNTLWVAIVEKAFAHHRRGANSYASIEDGWSIEVNRAFGSTSANAREIRSYGSAANLLNDMFNRWSTYQAVTIGFLGVVNGGVMPSNLVMRHMYTVVSFVRNGAGQITNVILRNPWGVDGYSSNDGSNDGLVSVSGAGLMNLIGSVNWGRV
jgi:hypothetical protein